MLNDAETNAGLVVRSTKQRGAGVGGTWATGRVAGYTFEALVFPGHAAEPAFELERSRISKLSIRVPGAVTAIAEFDRGWTKAPATENAQRAAKAVCDGLAAAVFAD